MSDPRILAIDPGTKCGWALMCPGWNTPESGVQDFSLQRGESPGMRFVRFRKWLEEMRTHKPEIYVYEAAHHRGGHATEVAVGFATRIIEEAAHQGAEHISVHTGTLKKWAAGHGKASKEEMISRAEEMWGMLPIDDNHADALHLLGYAMEKYGGGPS